MLFLAFFSQWAQNLWYCSVEREKIIGDALLNLTAGIFPDISSACVLLWTMQVKAMKKVRIIVIPTSLIEVGITLIKRGLNIYLQVVGKLGRFLILIFMLHAVLWQQKTQRQVYYTSSDIQWHFHLLNYVRLRCEPTSVWRHFSISFDISDTSIKNRTNIHYIPTVMFWSFKHSQMNN